MPSNSEDSRNTCCHRGGSADAAAMYADAIRSGLAIARQAAQQKREASISSHAVADEQYVRGAGIRADDREIRRLVRSLPYGAGGRRPALDVKARSGTDAALDHLRSLGLLSASVVAALRGGEAA